jgi:prepilin-type N-terminal cleavage/methylation domain-containing protein
MKLLHRKKASGFSLLELIVVVAIISIVSTMSLLTLRGAQGITTLNTARREAIGILELARAESTKRDINTSVIFNSNGTYTYQFSITGTLAAANHALPAGVNFQLPAGVTMLTVTYTPGGKATVRGNANPVTQLYNGISFVNSTGVKTLTISRAGDLVSS